MISLVVRNTVAAVMAAAGSVLTVGFYTVMDANPSLYIHDAVQQRISSKQQHWNGRHVWITGASSGIGQELALQLASKGANLILSSRNQAKLESVATSCRQRQPGSNRVWVLPLDVTCSQEVLESVIDQALEHVGGKEKLDCVVLNAGAGHLSPATKTSRQVSEQMMQINALGPMAMTQSLLAKTDWISRKNNKGQLVVVSSVAGKFAVPLSSSYAASKHALHGYFESLRSEHPSLRIHMICPGPIRTPFFSSQVGGNNTKSPSQQEASNFQMPVERCAQLIVSDMTRKSGGGEVWIARQPTLAFCYVAQYAPGLARLMLKKIGPVRKAAWEQGLDLYDPSTLRKVKLKKEQ